jgi:hypothetical protein
MPGYVCCHGEQNSLKALLSTDILTKLAIQTVKQGLERYYKMKKFKIVTTLVIEIRKHMTLFY